MATMHLVLESAWLKAAARVVGLSVGAIALVLAIISYRYYAFRRKLPPGPPGIPILGNLREMPKTHPWRTHTQMHRKYGPIFSMVYGRNTVVYLGTYDIARELLEKRSNIYSSRPRMVMVGECISQGNRSLILPYGEQWRGYRRLQGAFLSPRMSNTYRELQDLESKQLVSEFLSKDDFFKRFHRYSSSLTFALAYGKRVSSFLRHLIGRWHYHSSLLRVEFWRLTILSRCRQARRKRSKASRGSWIISIPLSIPIG